MAKLAELGVKEGGRHWRAKSLLFDFITDGRCKFVTQAGVIDTNSYDWTYASMEAFVASYEGCNDYIHAPSTGHCLSCGFDVFTADFESRFEKRRNEYNKNIVIYDPEQGIEAYSSDPCNFCEFNRKLEIKYIFDIALWREGCYVLAVEIVDTSPVKKNKLDFCRSNGIDLIVVNYADVIKSRLAPAHFTARFYKGR